MCHPINVVIVMTRCSQTKEGFGIRFEEKSSEDWVADWSFRIKDDVAKREGYDYGRIKGTFRNDEKVYPGCPYCKATSYARCGKCKKLSCWNGTETFICAWCGNTGKVEGFITELNWERR